jgi:hypothetical protein
MTEYGPSPFMADQDTTGLTIKVAPPVPGASGVGPIEAMKRALMVALRDALTGTSLSLNSSEIKVSMEYPMSKVLNPGIWVQFAYTDFNRAGIDHEIYGEVNGVICPIQEWIYYGRATLTIVAYSSIERDRLADALIGNISFARTPNVVLTNPAEDTKLFRNLIESVNANPYVFLTINTDSLSPGGQGMSVGTPWDPNQFVYEDNYTFDCVGQYNIAFTHDGTYQLTAFDIAPDRLEEAEEGWSQWI